MSNIATYLFAYDDKNSCTYYGRYAHSMPVYPDLPEDAQGICNYFLTHSINTQTIVNYKVCQSYLDSMCESLKMSAEILPEYNALLEQVQKLECNGTRLER